MTDSSDLAFNLTPEGVPIPNFSPWIPRRLRANGWSPAVQRAFIAELTRIGSVNAAAKAVGKTKRSAYFLREKVGAESFGVAWELAIVAGREQAQQVAIERALHGEVVPRFRNGRFTGYRILRNDRLLVAAMFAGKREMKLGEANHMAYSLVHRLEKWEAALRSHQMELDGEFRVGDISTSQREQQEEVWEDHIVVEREMKRERRRQRNLELRALVRRGLAKDPPVGPRIRLL
jgi:hypothetical protein